MKPQTLCRMCALPDSEQRQRGFEYHPSSPAPSYPALSLLSHRHRPRHTISLFLHRSGLECQRHFTLRAKTTQRTLLSISRRCPNTLSLHSLFRSLCCLSQCLDVCSTGDFFSRLLQEKKKKNTSCGKQFFSNRMPSSKAGRFGQV